tara:strand:- start:537 stop:806 length:270 start_codon:yes stop_codon:yes gene_type:complete
LTFSVPKIRADRKKKIVVNFIVSRGKPRKEEEEEEEEEEREYCTLALVIVFFSRPEFEGKGMRGRKNAPRNSGGPQRCLEEEELYASKI